MKTNCITFTSIFYRICITMIFFILSHFYHLIPYSNKQVINHPILSISWYSFFHWFNKSFLPDIRFLFWLILAYCFFKAFHWLTRLLFSANKNVFSICFGFSFCDQGYPTVNVSTISAATGYKNYLLL